jgi:hypothetical protein
VSIVGLLALVPLVPLWRQRRRRQRARLAAMRDEDARLEAALAASALDAVLAPAGEPARPAWAPRTES